MKLQESISALKAEKTNKEMCIRDRYRAFISRKRIETGGICDEEYYVCYGNDRHGKL